MNAKHLVWSPENEWRLFWKNDETKLKYLHQNINQNCVKAIYFGVTTSPGAEASAKFEAKKQCPNARLYKAEIKKGEYKIQFREI